MPKHLVCPDVSVFQRSLDSTFTRDFVIFRVTFGAHRLDSHFLANASAVKRLHNEGRIAGALLYTVYTSDPVRSQFDAVWKAIGPTIPAWLSGIMIDVESWRGQSYELSGDHSKAINQLYGLHAHRMGSWNSAIAYGNISDLNSLYPHRDRRCRVIVAAYSSTLSYKKVQGAIGQQYSDGTTRWGVPKLAGQPLPRSSSPFGACDHNVFPGIPDGNALVKLLRPAQLGNVVVKPRAPVVSVPDPTPSPHLYDVKRGDSLVSGDGAYALFMKNDGDLEIRHKGTHYAAVQKVK